MTIENRDLHALVRRIEELDIEVSTDNEGRLTVCTTQEPLFCFDADSIEAVQKLVGDTLASYARHFYDIDLPRFITQTQLIEHDSLAIEQTTPVSRLKPIFDLAA